MVLLDAVCHWRARQPKGPRIKAVHIHHGLHPNADNWSAQCETLCAGYGVSFECHRVQVDALSGAGVEASARRARYAIFEQLLQSNDVLLLGHHLDDQVETLLYRLLRGAGPKGLSAIPRERRLGRGSLLRPMLSIPRSTIDAWVELHNLQVIDDPSNADTQLDRNFLRHTVLPHIETRWPNYRQTLERATALQQAASTLLEEQPLELVEGPFGEPGLALRDHETEQQLAQRLYLWLVGNGFLSPGHRRLSEFARQCLTADADRCPELDIDGARLSRWREGVYRLDRSVNTPVISQEVVVGQVISSPSGVLSWDRHVIGLPQGITLRTRTRLPGEKLALIRGPTRSYKQLCQVQGIPPWWRDKLPVLCLDDVPVAIVGLGLLRGANALLSEDASAGFLPRWTSNSGLDSIE